MKTFNVPEFYRSPVISKVKQFRKTQDPRKKDSRPTVIDFGPVQYYIARYFGFCYGVENAIEIAFRALEENQGKKIYLLSEMIHNPEVNKDLVSRGITFLQDTHGTQLVPFDVLSPGDVVVIPAFGAPLALLELLEKTGIDTRQYNTTCPFVERVWKKSSEIGSTSHTIIIHGKYDHEETRSTFSRSAVDSEAVVVVRDLLDAGRLGRYVSGEGTQQEFEREFKGKHTPGFDISRHFEKVGIINQTTMLATETQEIAQFFRNMMTEKYGNENLAKHFADTRDTLCYATNENQDGASGLLTTNADLAIVVGGYNSSNTAHLAELCERKFPTYFISSEKEIDADGTIHHFDQHSRSMKTTKGFLPHKNPARIAITSGASCPDSVIDAIITRINSFFENVPAEIKHLDTYNN